MPSVNRAASFGPWNEGANQPRVRQPPHRGLRDVVEDARVEIPLDFPLADRHREPVLVELLVDRRRPLVAQLAGELGRELQRQRAAADAGGNPARLVAREGTAAAATPREAVLPLTVED